MAVDADLVIDFRRGKGLERRWSVIRLTVTAITAFELRVNADFLARRNDILRLVHSRTFPLDPGIAGEWSRGCEEPAKTSGWLDLPFATRNRKHFNRVDGLRLFVIDAG